jgi:integrase/recombinase XerD
VAPPSPSQRWPVLGEFRSWMHQHRGLTQTSLDVYDTLSA